MIGVRIFQPSYRMLVGDLADRASPQAMHTREQVAIVVRQYRDILLDRLGAR